MSEVPSGSYGSKPTLPETGPGGAPTGRGGDGAVSDHKPGSVPYCPHCNLPLEAPAKNGPGSNGTATSGEEAAAPGALSQVRLIGRFQLLEEVGQGSYGSVWRAWDPLLQLVVAVKETHSGPKASQIHVERARREARAVARLHHPHIVRLYEVLIHDGCPVLVYDFIEGLSLQDVLAAGRRLTATEAAQLIAMVADALDYAHSVKVVHRDIKPGNIMIACPRAEGAPPPDGKTIPLDQPVIVDFGLARREGAEADLTRAGEIVGTLTYMPPEQADGRGNSADGRSDIYSLGVVLYELLCGTTPFRGSMQALIDQVLRSEPPRPRRVEPRVPADLEAICENAMAKEPDKRYASARELADDLRRYLRGEPPLRKPIGWAERLWRWRRRNKQVANLILLVGLLLLSIIGVSSTFAVREYRGRLRSERQRAGVEIKLAQQEWKEGQLDLARKRLDGLKGDERDTRKLGFEWNYLDRICRLELGNLQGHTDAVTAVAFSPDGCWLASAGRDSAVVVWDIARGAEAFRLSGHERPVTGLAFSPDGKFLASVSGYFGPGANSNPTPGEVKLWDLSGDHRAFDLKGIRRGVRCVAFSPDGKFLACGGAAYDRGTPLPSEISVWDVRARKLISKLATQKHGPGGSILALAFSPDGKYLAAACDDQLVRVWDRFQSSSDAPIRIFKGHSAPVKALAFNPDGGTLASGGLDSSIFIWDLNLALHGTDPGKPADPSVPETIGPSRVLKGHSMDVNCLAYSPDGLWLASAGTDQIVQIWTTSRGGRPTEDVKQTLRGHSGAVNCVAFSPDTWRLATGGTDRAVKLWAVDGGRAHATLEVNPGMLVGALFTSDGKNLVTGGADRFVRVWNAEIGVLTDSWCDHGAKINKIAMNADGKYLASASDDCTVILRALPSGKVLQKLLGHTGPVRCVAFRGRSTNPVSGGADGTIRVWDSGTGRCTLQLKHGCPITAVDCDRKDRWIVSAGEDGSVKLWDAASGSLIRSDASHLSAATSVAFSLDGNLLASAGKDAEILLRDTRSGDVLKLFRGHAAAVNNVAFSPDGERLISASDDQTVRIWDTATGQQLLTLDDHYRGVNTAVFSADGLKVASASRDSTAIIWDGRPWTAEADTRRQALEFLDTEARLSLPDPSALPLSTLRISPSAVELAALVRKKESYLNKAVSQTAIDLVDPFCRGLAHKSALWAVQNLDTTGMLREEIVAEIANGQLSDAVRHEALKITSSYAEDPRRLNGKARRIALVSGAKSTEYQRALKLAERACELLPEEAACFISLGMAQYRLRHFSEAAAALTKAGEVGKRPGNEDTVARLALLVMTWQSLGEPEEAHAALDRLHQFLQRPESASPANRPLVVEAEKCCVGTPAPSDN